MTTKTKTIKLSGPDWRVEGQPIGSTKGYRVESIVNSTEFSPLQILSKTEVDTLCAARDWTVTINPIKR